jgi:spore coat polysaccharide biosynthesis protein SpsF (cytidylyltransferase family)
MICLVQARMSSKRFPGKIIKKINNIELIIIIYKRLLQSKLLKKIYISTSNHKSDDKLCVFLKKKKINFLRGDLNNVSKRLLEQAETLKVKKFMRICGDSPLIDYNLLDEMILKSKNKSFDLFTNSFPRTYPRGMGIEIISVNILKNFIKKFNSIEKEHVTQFFYNNAKKFKIINFKNSKNLSKLNYCVDDKNDLNFLRAFLRNKNLINYSVL